MAKHRTPFIFTPLALFKGKQEQTVFKVNEQIKDLWKFFAESRGTTMTDVLNAALLEFFNQHYNSPISDGDSARMKNSLFQQLLGQLNMTIRASNLNAQAQKASSGYQPSQNTEHRVESQENRPSVDPINWGNE